MGQTPPPARYVPFTSGATPAGLCRSWGGTSEVPGGLGANPGDGEIMAVPGLPIAIQGACGTIRGLFGSTGGGGTAIIETPPTADPFPGSNDAGSGGPIIETPPTSDGFPGAND